MMIVLNVNKSCDGLIVGLKFVFIVSIVLVMVIILFVSVVVNVKMWLLFVFMSGMIFGLLDVVCSRWLSVVW